MMTKSPIKRLAPAIVSSVPPLRCAAACETSRGACGGKDVASRESVNASRCCGAPYVGEVAI
jgi:hypothetical protein